MRRAIKWLPYRQTSFLRSQAVALAGVALATGARALAGSLVSDGLYFTFLFPALVATSMIGGMLAGCTTAVLGGLVSAYLWIPPAGIHLGTEELTRLTAFWFSASIIIAVCGFTRVILNELHEAQAQAHMLSQEMQHRVKNSLMVTSVIARQTMRNAESARDGERLFQARLMALSHAHDLLGGEVDSVVDLRTLLDQILAPFDPMRFTLKGGDVAVPGGIGVSLALLIHEMATNAAKYGALSTDGGRVHVEWDADAAQCRLEWRERGGPTVGAPLRKGFGASLMQAAFSGGRGAAAVAYEPDGVRCSATFPIAAPAGRG